MRSSFSARRAATVLLPAAGHADEHDILHLKAQLFPDALGLAVGDVAVFKDLRRALSLRDEHVEPAHIRNAELFRLQDKRCTRGVVDDIEHTLELREERQVDGDTPQFGYMPTGVVFTMTSASA